MIRGSVESQPDCIMLMQSPADILRIVLGRLCTPDLKLFAMTCQRIWLLARAELDRRLRFFPVHHQIHLNEQQQYALYQAVTARRNMLLQGAAGTGKSLVLRTIRHKLVYEKGARVFVVAPTGIAALNVGGMTLHEYLGIGGVLPSRDELLEMKRANRANVKRAKHTDAVILDEMSMVSAKLFGVFKMAMEIFRDDARPFGGVQVIFMGDLAQLRPVPDENKSIESSQYCIEHSQWRSVFGEPTDRRNVCLTQPMRQDLDTEFLELLNIMRGCCTPPEWAVRLMMTRSVEVLKLTKERLGPAMHLMPLRDQVNAYNKAQLDKLSTNKSCQYPTVCVFPRPARAEINFFLLMGLLFVQYHQQIDQEVYQFLTARHLLTKAGLLELREGARVILTKNFAAHRLCNGNTGYVRHMLDLKSDAAELFHLLEGDRKQSQILRKNKDVRRVRLLCDCYTELCLNCVPQRRNKASTTAPPPPPPTPHFRICQKQEPEAIHSCEAHISNPQSERSGVLPLVEFEGQPDTWYLMMPQTQSFYKPGPIVVEGQHVPGAWLDEAEHVWKAIRSVRYAAVLGMPLELCYSATMHKIQGLTLDKVSMSLNECWDPSQVYTALSRVRRLCDLAITSMPQWGRLYGQRSLASRAVVNRFLATVEASNVDAILREQRKREKRREESANKRARIEAPPAPNVQIPKYEDDWMQP
jgi:hypothetical protein